MTHEYIRDKVEEYVLNNGRYYIPNYNELSMQDIRHIINIGTSILLHKHNIVPYSPGDFVKALLNNDLEQTFSRADNINLNAIHFYVMLVNNIRL